MPELREHAGRRYSLQFHYALHDDAWCVELSEAVAVPPAQGEGAEAATYRPGTAFLVAVVPDEDPKSEPAVRVLSRDERVIPYDVMRWFMEHVADEVERRRTELPGKRSYRYVGPADLKDAVRTGGEGYPVRSAVGFESWAAERSAAELAEPFTFVVDTDGFLRLAPRRSEHVACAGGRPVLSAGEISFVRENGRWAACEVSNHSTGYCPDIDSWPAIAQALDQAGLGRPRGFTYEVIFRRCPGCQEHNIVREDDFICVFCGDSLPTMWNVNGLHESGAS